MKYTNIREKLNTGDIVLFSGKGGISTGIKWATNSKFSHVGLVLTFPEYGFVALMESTTLSKIKDITTGAFRRGVQIVPLSERLKSYNGEVAIRQLEATKLNNNQLKSLMNFRNEIKGRPYELSKIELLNSAYDGPFGHNKEDLSSLFCSELVAEAYQRLGLITENVSSNEFTPKDFSEKGNLKLIKGNLGAEITIA